MEEKGKRVLVCGDRLWNNYPRMFEVISTMGKIEVIIEGGCKGADLMSKEVGEALGIPIWGLKAEWSLYGDIAGPIRNERMIKEGYPDMVIAFHNDISKSRGTKDMIKQAIKHKVPVRLFTEKEECLYCIEGIK